MGAVAPSPPRRRTRVPAVVRLLRPGEWIKNGFVLAPVLFSGQFDEAGRVADAVLAFVAFCAIASAGYVANDLRDAELDRRHPTKRDRAIASGAVAPGLARALAVALVAIAFGVAALTDLEVVGLVAAYAALAAAYTLGLKELVIIDVMTIAALFLLRVVAGAAAADVTVSEWLLVCTGMLALFLGFTKRRQEASVELDFPAASRPVLEHYSLPFLDQMVALVTAVTVISYTIYAVDSPLIGSRMLVTVPAVLYGVFRYLYLIYDRNETRDAATLVTRDPGMLAAAALWALSALIVLYV